MRVSWPSSRATQDATEFARDLAPLLSERVLPAEHDLVRNTAAVIRVTHGFSAAERAALTRCVAIMCRGMPEFQRNKSLRGLEDLDGARRVLLLRRRRRRRDVHGAVLPALPRARSRNATSCCGLAVSFGQGLQMTNILKDIWDDGSRRRVLAAAFGVRA